MLATHTTNRRGECPLCVHLREYIIEHEAYATLPQLRPPCVSQVAQSMSPSDAPVI